LLIGLFRSNGFEIRVKELHDGRDWLSKKVIEVLTLFDNNDALVLPEDGESENGEGDEMSGGFKRIF
jgi:hypothetical protein